MKNDFKFEIIIKKTEEGFKDDISVSGTQIEILGSIEKTIMLLNEIKNKIREDVLNKTKE